MTQSSTPNDLVKNLYEPIKSYNNGLNSDEQLDFVSFEVIKNQLDQAYLEPSDSSIQNVLKYASQKGNR
jgi:hypothetical protein